MKPELVDHVLESLNPSRQEGSTCFLDEEMQASVLIAFPAETLTLARVVKIERLGEVTAVESIQGDRYYVATESIHAIRVLAPEKRSSNRGPGFR